MQKAYLYIGYYFDITGNFILKVGTTNDINRRKHEHDYNYRRASRFIMPVENEFHYLWYKEMSKYSTFRYEDSIKEQLKLANVGEYLPNDRFIFQTAPCNITFKIRKQYIIPIAQ